MNIEAQERAALIQAVTAEVLKRLAHVPADEPSVQKRRIVVMSEETMPALELGLNLNAMDELCYYEESMRDCDLLVIPQLCLQLLSNLAQGISAGSRERFVLTMLLKGKQVVALEEGLMYRKYKSTAPVLLYKLYDGWVDKLSSYGVRFVREADLEQIVLAHGQAIEVQDVQKVEGMQAAKQAVHPLQAGASPTEAARMHAEQPLLPEVISCKVITEAEVKKCRLQNRNEIVIGQNSIITPLAQDYLRMQQMQVHRR
ncbi:ethanolamine utilization protein [Paenibacillus sp. ACRRX]|uniref:ethanolamine utilization protein n=1 Tax=Paenibacillus sp. ACRRX TaxID=2918206 RepID=UPI001EF586C9|nr:ethanolamine utilization protein [Paenibacillus sp. ACRRX]MCG7405872.1 ethanolamine utilization protein [Paenibacillus sp. ACRRX]